MLLYFLMLKHTLKLRTRAAAKLFPIILKEVKDLTN